MTQQITRSLLIILLSTLISGLSKAQCPRMVSVMIDACNGTSTEGDNEYMVLQNGNINMQPGTLNVYYSTMTPPSGASGTSLTTFGGSAGFIGTYSPTELAQINALNAISSCGNVFATSIPATGIPAGAFIVIMSPSFTENYNFSGLCQQAPVYLLFQQVNSGNTGFNINGSGRFKNNSGAATNTPRYFSLTSSSYSSCTEAGAIRTYFPDQLIKFGGIFDGGTVAWNVAGTTTAYLNSGCVSVTALPLVLTMFSGRRMDDNVKLQWSIANAEGIDEFLPQSSTDGIDFLNSGSITASASQLDYAYNLTKVGNNKFFRLKVVYRNGKNDFSNTLNLPVDLQTDYHLILLSGVQNHLLTAQINAPQTTQCTMVLYDVNGRKMLERRVILNKGTNLFTIDASNLAVGHYFLKINTGETVQMAKWFNE